MTLMPYVGSVINLGNSFSQATRANKIGQVSDLIQDFRNSSYEQTVEGWEAYYNDVMGKEKIAEASEKIWEYVKRIRKNLNKLTEEDVYNWTKDLIVDKTFSGLQVQLDILKMCCNGKKYRLATPKEEAKGIDGFIGKEPVSIKPNSYRKTINKGKEKIPYRIIYYTKGKAGLKIVKD